MDQLRSNKSRVYNFLTNLLLREIHLEQAQTHVIFTLDRSKSKLEIREFNEFIQSQLESKIPPHVPLIINHDYSHENKLLQAVDMFAGGIFRKYEFGDTEWYDVFRDRIAFEQVYPK